MKRVLFKKWINIEYDEKPYQKKKDTGCFESEFTNFGLFHEWGLSYEEFENGGCSYSIAIIELLSGEIVEVLPINIKFLK